MIMNKLLLSALMVLSVVCGFSQERPNVLFVMVDDMNDWVGAFGGNQQAITPNIDALAKKSVVFENAYCAAPLCNPSRTSLLTGYRPSTTGIYGNTTNFRDLESFKDVVTLPQYFEKNGYKTAAAGKIFHSPRGNGKEPKPGSDPGSFQQEKKGGLGGAYPDKKFLNSHGLQLKERGVKGNFIKAFDWYPVDVSFEDNNDWKSADYCAQFLEDTHDKPFFLACGIFRPHLPWFAPKEFFELYDVDKIKTPKVLENDLGDLGKTANRISKKTVHNAILETDNWKEAVRAYLANLSFADACVGHVMNALNKSAYNKNTIVVLMGDHGWNLGEKEHWGKGVVWERSAKTPLLIFDPRDSKPRVSSRVVSLMDVYPTLVDICSLPKNNELEGESIKQVLKNENAKWDDAAVTSKSNGIHSLRTKRYRYISYSNGEEELYDHETDPLEWNNLADKKSSKPILKELSVKLNSILKK